eukprot:m.157252 g.157252  ORF g.157252 m.157252 type:complete len:424 (+) comp15163_c0_seq10:199-1470(+)
MMRAQRRDRGAANARTLQFILACFVAFLLAPCVSSSAGPTITTDQDGNLVLNGGASHNISAVGAALLLNNQPLATQAHLAPLFALASSINASQNRLLEAMATQEEKLAGLTSQVSQRQSALTAAEAKLAVLMPLVRQACAVDPSLALTTFFALASDLQPLDFTTFHFNGSSHLAVAVHSSGGDLSTNSLVFRFDRTTQQYLMLQALPTLGARAVRYFVLGNTSFLVFANHFDGINYQVNSSIYRLDPTRPPGLQWVLHQSLPTLGASALDVFTLPSVPGSVFLAVGFFFNSTGAAVAASYILDSIIYRMDSSPGQDPATARFVVAARFPTFATLSVRTLVLGNTTFLVAGSLSNGTSNAIKTPVYRIDPGPASTPGAITVTRVQQLDTVGASRVVSFTVGNTSYLAIGGLQNGTGSTAAGWRR